MFSTIQIQPVHFMRYRKYVKPAKRNEEFAQKIQSDFKLYL
jgi:hypothetical protein